MIFRTLIATCIAFAQLQGQHFDIASVRTHDPNNKTFVVHMPTAGRFTAEGAPLKLLVMLAYGVQESQIVGGPAWFGIDPWDIDAKCDEDRYSSEETRRMLQGLLEQRFLFTFHHASEQRPVYVLTVLKGGPKLTASEKNATNVRSGKRSISIDRGSIGALAGVLATPLGRPVVDHTGLSGLYDISVTWDDAPVRDGGVPGIKESEAPLSTNEHGSIFTAVQEQLGLRLAPSRAAVEVLGVDNVKRPEPK